MYTAEGYRPLSQKERHINLDQAFALLSQPSVLAALEHCRALSIKEVIQHIRALHRYKIDNPHLLSKSLEVNSQLAVLLEHEPEDLTAALEYMQSQLGNSNGTQITNEVARLCLHLRNIHPSPRPSSELLQRPPVLANIVLAFIY